MSEKSPAARQEQSQRQLKVNAAIREHAAKLGWGTKPQTFIEINRNAVKQRQGLNPQRHLNPQFMVFHASTKGSCVKRRSKV